MSTKRKAADNKRGAPQRRSKPWQPDIEKDLKQVIADHESQESTKGLPNEDFSSEADAPLIRLVNSLLYEAVKRNASDIHIEPFENLLRVRFRIDGVLQEIQQIPHKLAAAIVSRLKIMADLDICEKRIPQDGVIKFRVEKKRSRPARQYAAVGVR